jgi:hypothetical protein
MQFDLWINLPILVVNLTNMALAFKNLDEVQEPNQVDPLEDYCALQNAHPFIALWET